MKMKFKDWINEAKSMTYGEIPSFSDFKRHFRKEVGETYNYNLKGSDARTAKSAGIPVSGDFTDKELYAIVKKLINAWEDGDNNAGDLASGIMITLDYEWI
jgi:hypothetical protein